MQKLKKKQLLEMIKTLEERIEKLEKRSIVITSDWPKVETITLPFIQTTDACDHEYPNPWHAVVPPPCKKCGKL